MYRKIKQILNVLIVVTWMAGALSGILYYASGAVPYIACPMALAAVGVMTGILRLVEHMERKQNRSGSERQEMPAPPSEGVRENHAEK